MHPYKKLKEWWRSLRIADKFGAILLLLLLIGIFETAVSIIAIRIVNNAGSAALTSLDIQRYSLEMSRDWESMQYYQYRFFAEYKEIGYSSAKERYAIPAGEKISSIIRTGASLRRIVTAPGASENLRNNDPVLKQFIANLSKYASSLENGVQLASDLQNDHAQAIQEKLAELNNLNGSIEPSFTVLILMAQNEVFLARSRSEQIQKSVNSLLFVINLFGITLVLVIVILFRRYISNSVSKLTYASNQMKSGHLGDRVNITNRDEFGQIASAFNNMAEAVQKRTDALREVDFRYQALFNQSDDAVMIIGVEGEILNANERALRMYGFDTKEMIGMRIQSFSPVDQQSDIQEKFDALRSGKEIPVFETNMKRKDGSIFQVEINITRVLDENGKPLYMQSISRDISGRKENEAQLRMMAMYDGLTGLPNRMNLSMKFSRAIADAQENREFVAVLFLDMDGFKQVNDRFGHEQGDLLLTKIGGILKDSIRKSDMVARVGGDEFVIILENILAPHTPGLVADKIIHALSKPLKIAGETINLSTSVGISLFPTDGEDLEILINCADKAMYQVKSNKKNGYLFYKPDLN